MIKEHYSIGETAKLLGISTQTLRFYDKIDLLSPSYISEETGYRYYSFSQFHYLDRIRYLQQLGMPLRDIREVIKNGEVAPLLEFLERSKEESLKTIKKLQSQIKSIEWYKNYFTYMDSKVGENIYKITLDKRFIFQVPCYKIDKLADMEMRLAEAKNNKEFQQVEFKRQYGYKIDYDAFCDIKFQPSHYFIYIKSKKGLPKEYVDELPAGDYLCLRCRMLEGKWNPSLLKGIAKSSKVMVALEYEDNLIDYSHAMYEIQILLQ